MPIRPSYSTYYSGLPAILNIDLNLIISTVTFLLFLHIYFI
jgi:hypothetical protein